MADYVTAQQLYEIMLKHPDGRVVGALPEANACTPFRFAYIENGLGFYTDLTSTQYHRHALCEEILPLIGDYEDELDFEEVWTDDGFRVESGVVREKEGCPTPFGDTGGVVLVKDAADDPWDTAKRVTRITRDDSAGWIKLHY